MFIKKFRSDYIARGPVAAALPYIAAGAQAVGAVKSIFDEGPDQGGPSQGSSSSVQGYGALPDWAKDLYSTQYAGTIGDYLNSQGSHNLNPVAPFNQYQNQALQQYGQGIGGINKDLNQYMNPYQEAVTNPLNRQYDAYRQNLLGAAQRNGGVGALKSSSVGTQLLGNEEARNNALAQANYQNYQQAREFRRQTLADMMNAGNIQQQQAQSVATSQAQAPLQRSQALGGLLGQIPTGAHSSAQQVGERAPQAAQPNGFQRFAGFAQGFGSQLNNNAFSGLWNNGTPQPGQYGPPAPGIFNNLYRG